METAQEQPRRARKRRRGGPPPAAAAAEGTPSAFRLAERQYKLYRNPKLQKQQCFASVVDFRDLDVNTDANRAKIIAGREISAPAWGEQEGRTLQVFGHHDRDGFFFIPGALTPRGQLEWARRCLAAYPNAPHHTNLGIMPFSIWQAHTCKDGKDRLSSTSGGVTGKRRRATAAESPALLQATVLPADAEVPPISKLRWATLGYHYDWTANVYHEGAHWHTPFPTELAELVRAFTSSIFKEPFAPEAAIVNYYQTDTMLKAHQDESEFTFDSPIVSFSIGCDCIFLLGGTSTDQEPTAIRFRSGDLMFMSGDSRVAFHGVPRVLQGTFDSKHFCTLDSSKESRLIAEYLSTARINVNVRQVFPSGREHAFPTDAERKERLRERCEQAEQTHAQQQTDVSSRQIAQVNVDSGLAAEPRHEVRLVDTSHRLQHATELVTPRQGDR